MTPETCRRKLDTLLQSHALAARQVREETKSLGQAEADLDAATKAQALAQQVAEQVQSQAHLQLASVVSRCLQTVFGKNAYEFKIRFTPKRGKTEAELLFCRDGMELDPPEASGGGAIDVASFALRLACLLLERPPKRRLLILDEPFKFVSRGLRGRIRSLLEELAGELGFQIIMVTHMPEIATGKVIRLE